VTISVLYGIAQINELKKPCFILKIKQGWLDRCHIECRS